MPLPSPAGFWDGGDMEGWCQPPVSLAIMLEFTMNHRDEASRS